MLKRYGISIAVVVVFAVLLAVVLLTQPKSDNSSAAQTAGVASAPSSTPNPDAAKLKIISLASDDTINKLVITQLSAAATVLTTTTAATTVAIQTTTPADTGTATLTTTPTPFVASTPGQTRKLSLDFLPAPVSTWKIAANPNFPVDSSQIQSVTDQLSNLSGAAALPADAANNLAQYGLDKPALTILIQSIKAGSKTLDVGNLNAVTQNYWVKLEGGNQVWTLAASSIDTLKNWLDTPPMLPPTPTAEPTTPTPNTPGAATTSVANTSGGTSAVATTPAPNISGTAATTTTAPATTTVVVATTVPATTTAVSTTTK